MKDFTPNFTPNPGFGWMFFDRRVSDDVALWQGHLSGQHGTRYLLQAQAVDAPKKKGGKHYVIKIVQPASEGNPEWKHIGSFEMPAFSERSYQLVDTPLGKMRAVRQLANAERSNCVKFRILSDAQGHRNSEAPF